MKGHTWLRFISDLSITILKYPGTASLTNFVKLLLGRIKGSKPAPDHVFCGAAGACTLFVDTNGILNAASASLPTLIPGASGGTCFVGAFLPEDRARLQAALAHTAPSRTRAHARRADGSIGAFDLHIDPKDEGAAVMLIDRTEDKQRHERSERAAEKARADARASASALADLSHEMKTPLNAVIGFADAIRRETFGPLGNEKYAEYIGDIHTSGTHLLDLVESILDLARIEAKRLTFSPVLSDPAAIAYECAAMVREPAQKGGLNLIVDIADDIPECMIDPRAVRQILLNLLSNAVKFTSDGEVRLSIQIDQDTEVPKIVFTVKDTGIGMSDEEMARLGPRFTDIQGAGVRGAEGTGLGLSLVFKLAELHGGTLTISSAPGEGVCARVALPLTMPNRSGISESAPSTRTPRRKAENTPRPAPTDSQAQANLAKDAALNTPLTQLERIEAYRREVAKRQKNPAA